ncbi:MAG: cupin domain-containing protein [bacterium]|nr:cupin domain-containing protein [bacterium]
MAGKNKDALAELYARDAARLFGIAVWILKQQDAASETQTTAMSNAKTGPAHTAYIQTRAEGDWYSPAPGVQCKRLFTNDERGYRSTLMRMDPGSSFPAHVHRGVEEACVLEGRCEFDGAALAVGDYFRAQAGSRHGTLTSPEGCLMIILEHSRVGR